MLYLDVGSVAAVLFTLKLITGYYISVFDVPACLPFSHRGSGLKNKGTQSTSESE